MKFIVSARECGDGLWIPFPESIVNSLELAEGDTVNLTVRNGTLIVKKNNMSYKDSLENALISEERA